MSLFPEIGAQERLPVSLITGFLGSGKTTLLNRLLRHPDMASTAIVINEFGEIPLDQHFIERSDGEVVVMANGCLCCTVQGDIEGVVGTLFARRDRGDVPTFERMLIETTGLADPAPIMQLLLSKPLIVDNFALDAVIATVDAVHALRHWREHGEAVKQAALADRIVITKTDLASADEIAAVMRRIETINRTASIFHLPQEDFTPSRLFDAEANGPRAPERWLGNAAEPAPGHDHGHLHDIDSFSLVIEEPLDWHAFSRWLTRIKVRHAERLLRVKGILAIAGEDGKVAIHGVHHVFHPPLRLPRRADDDARSRIVFITRGLAGEEIAADWRAFGSAPRP